VKFAGIVGILLRTRKKISLFPEKSQNNLDKSTSLRYNKGVVIKEGYVPYPITSAQRRNGVYAYVRDPEEASG
jgi:hypothetical protein